MLFALFAFALVMIRTKSSTALKVPSLKTLARHKRILVNLKQIFFTVGLVVVPAINARSQECTIPYRALSGSLRPELDVRLSNEAQSVSVAATVDSGADGLFFPLSSAVALGLDLRAMPKRETAGVGNAHNTTFYARVHLQVTLCGVDYRWESLVGFVDGLPNGEGLLGQAGFLNLFQATLDASNSQLHVRPVIAGLEDTRPATTLAAVRYTKSTSAETRLHTSVRAFAFWVDEKKWKQNKMSLGCLHSPVPMVRGGRES